MAKKMKTVKKTMIKKVGKVSKKKTKTTSKKTVKAGKKLISKESAANVSNKTAKKAAKSISKTVTKKGKMEAATNKKVNTKADGVKSKGLGIGDVVPNFIVKTSKNTDFHLEQQKGRKTVLYFYPKDDTPGCTIEGKDFTAFKSQFDKLNVDIFGISRDSVKSHDKFVCKYNFSIELLSDENEALCKIFDVIKQKNMYGKLVMGIERSTFVLDENLKIIIADRKVKAEGHAEEILRKLREMN